MHNYSLDSNILIRTPLLSLECAVAILKKEYSLSELTEEFLTPIVKEALYIASPNFFSLLEDSANLSAKEEEAIKQTLMKYLLRMSTRATPFGLFAGYSLGKWNKTTDLRLSSLADHQRKTRINMWNLHRVIEHLLTDKNIRLQTKFFANNTIRYSQREYRYFEQYRTGKSNSYKLSSVEKNEYISYVLEKSKNGIELFKLIHFLTDKDIPEEVAYNFLNDLIENRLLINEFEPNVTGKDYLQKMTSRIQDFKKINNLSHPIRKKLDAILQVEKSLSKIDQLINGKAITCYDEIKQLLQQVNGIESEKQNGLFQINLRKTMCAAQLNAKLAGSLRKSISILHALTPTDSQVLLTNFKKAFINRYDTLEVPLLEVLDSEVGIGFIKNNLCLNDTPSFIDFIEPQQQVWESNGLDRTDRWRYRILLKALEHDKYEYHLNEEDLAQLNLVKNIEDLADTLTVHFEFLGENEQQTNLFIRQAGGSTGGHMTSRFTKEDNQLRKILKGYVEYESQLHLDAIVAEIVHMPDPIYGNILSRDKARQYEIPIISPPSVKEDYILPLSDLLLCVRNNQIQLKSKKHEKLIIPKLTSVHNFFRTNMPIYRFLCSLQHQNKKARITFNWGKLESTEVFFPRIVYKNVILSRATWIFREKELRHLKSILKKKHKDEITIFKNKWNLPNEIVVVQGDNELHTRLNTPTGINILSGSIKNNSEIIIAEFLHSINHKNTLKSSKGLVHTNEMITVFRKNKAPEITLSSHNNNINACKVQQKFPFGSHWLYFKIYAGYSTTNVILTQHILPLMNQFREDGLIDKWFFIRYVDSDNHLRLRLHIPELAHFGTILGQLQVCFSQLTASDFSWKIVTDTYIRELERYGHDSIELIEQFFCFDSILISKAIGLIQEKEDEENLLWQFALLHIDNLLNSFEYATFDKQRIFHVLSTSYAKEFSVNKTIRNTLNSNYKKHYLFINNIIKDKKLGFPLKEIETEMKIFSSDTFEVVKILKDTYSTQNNLNKLEEIMISLIHMSINRIFRSNQRRYELVLYNYLNKYYTSQVNRK